MKPSPAQSALEIAAVNLRGICCAILRGLGAWGIEPARQKATYNWISAKFRRFETLLAQYRAGKLRRVLQRAAMPGRKTVRRPELRMLRKWAWLVQTGTHHAAGYGSQLQHVVLQTPEIAEFLEACPQAKRTLRPLCRALAIALPWTVDAARAEKTPRVRKPRPKPEPDRSPLPRGVKTWIRKEKRLEQCLKLKHEFIAKMALQRQG